MGRSRYAGVLVMFGALAGVSLAPATASAQQRNTGTGTQQGGADMSFAPEGQAQDAPPADGPPSEAMANALRLYQQERYQESCVQFQRVVENETGDAPAQIQKAQFHLGKCLYHLRFYQSALAVFDEIVEHQNGRHLYFASTLQWLAQLASQLPEPADIIRRVGRYSPEQLNQFNNAESRDLYNQLLFLLGRAKYNDGNFEEAVGLFNQVQRNSSFYVQARFFMGISHVRNHRSQPAIDAFTNIQDAISEGVRVEDSQRMNDLAWLERARLYYSTRHYDSAIEAWNRVDVDSEYWLDSLFEESWAYYLQQDYARALGNIHTLNSPYFANAFYPESLVLKSVIFFSNCHYDEAESVIAQFNQRYGDVRPELQRYLQQYGDNNSFFRFLKEVRSGSASLPARLRPIVETALGDRTLLRNIEYVNVLESEERRLAGMPPAFRNSSLGARVLQDISVAKSFAVDQAGDLARGRYQRLLDELQDLQNQTTAILIEILNARRGQLSAAIAGEQQRDINTPAARVVADEEHYLWPFNGEYWRDELGFYRQQIAPRCGR
ncbi:MAG: tetratricopeptide repeat protein [Deltaproteobacteria bacterium]|nr:tetratricopeptide repeat protein [Deltaproteobacteria bacterium]